MRGGDTGGDFGEQVSVAGCKHIRRSGRKDIRIRAQCQRRRTLDRLFRTVDHQCRSGGGESVN